MKRILLASASIVAFAGAAAADHVNEETPDGVSLGGSAELGYNDEIEGGFYVEGGLGFTLARELDNGLLAAATFGLDVLDDSEDDFGDDNDLGLGNDFVLSLTDRTGSNGLHFGDTMFAAERHWFGTTDASGIRIPDAYDGAMAADDFSEQDDETAIRGDTTFGTFNTSLSYVIADADGDSADDVDQLSIGASGVIGGFTTNIAYQAESDADFVPADTDDDGDIDDDDEDFSQEDVFDEDNDDDFSSDEVFGVSVGTTFAGADVRLAYATNRSDDESSLGVSAQFPAGPVTVSGYYTLESGEDDSLTDDEDEGDVEDSFGVAVGYDTDTFGVSVGFEDEQGDDDTFIDARYSGFPSLDVFVGYSRDEEGYIGAEYDLGGGATALASYAETDEAGPREYKEGTTVALALSF